MPSRHPSPLARPLFALAALLLVCCGLLRSASGQVPDFGNPGQTRAPNPQVGANRAPARRTESRAKRPAGGPAQPAPDARAEEKPPAAEQAIAAGNQARDRNDYEQALIHYQTARDLSPQDARALYGIGNLYADLFCHDSAIVAYVDALKIKKDYPEALTGLGWAYLGKERYDEAGEQFRAVLKLNPKSVEANMGLGHVYSKQRKHEEAAARMNLVIDDPGADDKQRAQGRRALGVVYWNQEKHREAIEQFRQSISLQPDLARAYVDLGIALMSAAHTRLSRLGHTKLKDADPQQRAELHAAAREATANFEKAKQRFNFNHPVLYQSLAVALAYQSRFEEASRQLDQYFAEVQRLAARLSLIDAKCDAGFNRLNADGRWYQGYVYYLEGEDAAGEQRRAELTGKAVEQLNQAVRLKPDYANAYGLLAIFYMSLEKFDDAISQYEKAISLTADEHAAAENYQSLGLAYSRKGNHEQALKYLREALRIKPDNPSTHESLASVYIAQGKLEETLAALNKATELRKEPGANASPYYYLGVTYSIRYMHQKDEKDFQEALKLLKKAAEMRPADHMFHHALAITYEMHGDADEAVASYKKAIEYDPKNASYHHKLAVVYANLKRNKEAAIESLRKAVELKPDYAEAHRFLGTVYYRRDSKDPAALKQLLLALELDPKLLPAHYDLAFHYKSLKNYADAVRHLKTATELAPNDYYPYKELAKVYEEQQKADEAVRYYEEAIIRVKKDDAATLSLYRGRIERLRGRYAEAIALFRKVNYPDDGAAQSHFDIGVVHVLSKNKRAALEEHQRLVQLKSPLADELMAKIKEMK